MWELKEFIAANKHKVGGNVSKNKAAVTETVW